MNLEEIRARGRKVVTSPITGIDYTIRRLLKSELLTADIPTILPAADSSDDPKLPKETEAQQLKRLERLNETSAAAIRFAVASGTVSPRIVYTEPVPDGAIHASCIADDEDWLANEITSFSGFGPGARKKVKDATKNENGSELPTT